MTKIPTGKSNKKQVRNFFIVVGVVVGVCLLIGAIGVFVYVTVMSNETAQADNIPESKTETKGQNATATTTTEKESGGFIANLLLPPERTNFLVMGVDKGEALTDVIIVGTFDRDTQKISLISVPRDTYYQLNDDDKAVLKDLGKSAPSVVKINALHSYAGTKDGAEFLKTRLENMLGIDIDYYAEVNLKAFKNIVTTIEGVEMDIPEGGLYYSDPEQDLHISIPGGRQVLDADKAEGVVRFRSYAQGDMKRIEMQQEFLKALFSQVMNKDTLVNNAGSFMSTIISYVRTDFGITDIPLYLRYVTSLDAEKFETHTLPGTPKDIGEASYFIYDPDATAELVQQIFYSSPEEEEEEDSPDEEPDETAQDEKPKEDTVALSQLKAMKTQVLNGTGKSGLASSTAQRLKDEGFNIADIGDYSGSKQSATRIVSRMGGIASGFGIYFEDIEEIIDPALPSAYDIVIILGTSEKS